jgi:hypothetical protein
MRIAGVLAILVVCAAGVGCMVGTVDTSDPELDEAALGRVELYRSMAKINVQPYMSDLGAFAINCYAYGDLAGYRKIHPERTGANVTMAPGTMIVREVLDAGGLVTKLTVMAKGPPGYDSRLGDWWFAVTDPRGVPLQEKGAAQVGRLTQCHDCHIDRARDDFLFGVPSNAT